MCYALVYYVMTGWHVFVFDSVPLCDYWLASNANRLHGALYANGITEWDDAPDAKHCQKWSYELVAALSAGAGEK